MESQIRHEHLMEYSGHSGYESMWYCPTCNVTEFQLEECL